MSGERAYGDLTIAGRLLAEARPYWLHIGAVLTLGLLAAPLALLTPLPLKIAVDSVVGDDPLPGFLDPVVPTGLGASPSGLLLFAAILVVVIAVLTHLQGLGETVMRTYTGEKLVLRFRAKLFRHAQRLSLSHHDRAGTTDSLYRIQYDAPAIQWVALDGFIPMLTAALTLVGMIVVTAIINLQLALVALLVSPILIALTWWFRNRLRDQRRDVKRLEHGAFSVTQEALGALRVVKAFGQEDHEQGRFEDQHRRRALPRDPAGAGRGHQPGRASRRPLLHRPDVRPPQDPRKEDHLSPEVPRQRRAGLHPAGSQPGRGRAARRPPPRPRPGRGRFRRRLVQLRRPCPGPPGRQLSGPRRSPGGDRGHDGSGEVHPGRPPPPFPRSGLGADPAGRRGPAGFPARGPPEPVRHRAPGAGALFDHRGREHRLRAARTRPSARSRTQPVRPRSTISSRRSRRGTTPWSASEA